MRLPAPTRSNRLEFLDLPAAHQSDLAPNLNDIRLLNRWFGGTSLALGYVVPYLRRGVARSILDVATGSADIPAVIARYAIRHGISTRITGVDLSEDVLGEARRVVGELPIELVQGDARRLPFPDGWFDVATCFLALHHFQPDDAVVVLREMNRVARHAVIVTDLRRSYAGYAGVWFATRIVARNRLTRHDGPLSVLRAYSPDELAALADAAGLDAARVSRHAFFRAAVTSDKDGRHA